MRSDPKRPLLSFCCSGRQQNDKPLIKKTRQEHTGAAPPSVAAVISRVNEELARATRLHQRGDIKSAAAGYRKILMLDAGHAHAHLNLGAVLMSLGDFAGAVRSFDCALAANSHWALAWSNRGNAQLALKQPEAALLSYQTALQLDPRDPRAHCNRGNALRELGHLDDAVQSYQQALALKSDYVLALKNCASLLGERLRPYEALDLYRRALGIDANDREAQLGCGNMLLGLSRPLEALKHFEQVLAREPKLAEAQNSSGIAQMQLEDFAAALASFDRALVESPRSAAFWSNRGEALRRLKRFTEAAKSYSKVLDIAPDFALAAGKRLSAKLLACEWSSYDRLVGELERGVAEGRQVCAPFEFLAVSRSAALQRECAELYAPQRTALLEAPPPRVMRRDGDKIRLAYVSGDFGNRPTTYLLAGVLEQHDREQFEVIGISLRPPDASPMGQRVQHGVDSFIDISALSDRDAINFVAELDIHIAVDLMGHTHGSRPGIFHGRVAPIQVNYLGFPATSGLVCMDYIMGDDFVIPDGSNGHYTEQVAVLPECFQANDAARRIGPLPTREQVGLPDSAFVFCSFNNSYKYNPTMFDIWCRLLLARPGSVLWLVADTAEVATNLRSEASHRCVDPGRLVFADRVPYEEHLGRQALADLFLDTLPFNAGTTASDALFAGLPVLTCAGEAFASRMAGSLLRAAGLPELITHSLDEYERRALDLSGGGSQLQDLRARLHAVGSRPPFDTRRFCRHLETAYRQMWARHVAGFTSSSG